jgi:hypothetical protein
MSTPRHLALTQSPNPPNIRRSTQLSSRPPAPKATASRPTHPRHHSREIAIRQLSAAGCRRCVGLVLAHEPALLGTPCAVWASAAVIASWSEASHRDVIASRCGKVSVAQVPVPGQLR